MSLIGKLFYTSIKDKKNALRSPSALVFELLISIKLEDALRNLLQRSEKGWNELSMTPNVKRRHSRLSYKSHELLIKMERLDINPAQMIHE